MVHNLSRSVSPVGLYGTYSLYKVTMDLPISYGLKSEFADEGIVFISAASYYPLHTFEQEHSSMVSVAQSLKYQHVLVVNKHTFRGCSGQNFVAVVH